MKSRLLYGCLLSVVLLPTALHADSARLTRDARAYELSLKGQSSGLPGATVRATASYSATTVGGPSWTRPFADCTGATGLGPMTLHVQEFSVNLTGAYDVSSVQDGGWDGYVFVYQNAFNPASPNANCVIGDDDGPTGIGTSEIVGVALTAGTTYFVVTTGFENGEQGTFTNTISGPGDITIGPAGPQADLSISKTAPDGVVANGQFTYALTAANAGPENATGVVVTDVLPAGLTFVSSTCGATVAGSTVTWNIGALANGASQNCTLTVSQASASCPTVSNTATITGTQGDGNGSNNSSTASNGGGNVVGDPSFEGGSPNATWTEASTNFGSPLCTAAACGLGTGTGPRTGTWWSWFGGIAAPETGSLQQSVVIPTGAPAITFWAEFPICANGTDFVRLTIDGVEVWREDGNSPRCGVIGYSQVSVPLTAGQANGAAHTLRFESTISGAPSGSNFFIDDVSIVSAPICSVGAVNADLSITYTTVISGSATLGSTVGFNVNVSNAGPGAATGVVATIVAPANVNLVSNTCGATQSGNTATWSIGGLASGASASCSLSATVALSGVASGTATVTSASTDPVAANNTASAGVSVAFALPFSGPLGLLVLLGGVAIIGVLGTLRRS